MKKIIALVLVLLMVCSAMSEEFTPAMFLGSRGLIVMDEQTLNSMGESESEDGIWAENLPREIDFCVYSPKTETSSEVIIFAYDGVLYAAFSMESMFTSQDNGSVMGQTFFDFCNAYDFDLYAYGVDNGDMVSYGDYEAFKAAMLAIGMSEEELNANAWSDDGMLPSKEDFMEQLQQYIQ